MLGRPWDIMSSCVRISHCSSDVQYTEYCINDSDNKKCDLMIIANGDQHNMTYLVNSVCSCELSSLYTTLHMCILVMIYIYIYIYIYSYREYEES